MSEVRQLLAIMFTDVVGYTSLMGEDERQGLAILDQKQRLIKPILEKFNGEKLKDLGDGTLSSFRSAVDAVNCAIHIQQENLQSTDFSIRIGIHIGDVIFREGDIFGDGVNVASRIERLAEPGGICVSGSVYENIRNQTDIRSFYLGDKILKNVTEPIKVYALTANGLPAPLMSKLKPDKPLGSYSRKYAPLVLLVVFCSMTLLMFFNLKPALKKTAQVSNEAVPAIQTSPDKDNSIIIEVSNEDRKRNINKILELEQELESIALQIEQINNKLIETTSNEETDITTVSALIEAKESTQRHLDELNKTRAEIIINDIAAYETIVQSPSGNELQLAAWNKLISYYPEVSELNIGDVVGINLLLLKKWVEPTTGIEIVYLEEGCFQMGDSSDEGSEDEKPVHEVCLNAFGISRHELTQGQWQKIMGSNPAKFAKGANYPVEQVSWFDTQGFIRKLNIQTGRTFRLPTEAEWEYAACSVSQELRDTGGNGIETRGWYRGNSQESTHPVGTREPNELGLFDMSGNVWEWCSDWYGKKYYQHSLRENPPGPSSGTLKVFRGGCWNGSTWLARCTNRDGFKPGYSLDNLGFRIAMSVD